MARYYLPSTGMALFLTVAMLLGGSPATATETGDQAASDTPTWQLDQINVVRSLVAKSLRTGAPAPERIATDLGVAGGHAAAVGLAELLDRGGRSARLPALQAAQRIALRSTPLAQALREVVRTGEPEERTAAVMALGTIGDGRDVGLVLALAASERGSARTVCFDALRAITGADLPPSAARWHRHCETARQRAALLLPPMLDRMESMPDESDPAPDLRRIAQSAWAAPELIHEAIGAWLYSPNRRLREAALVLVADLRLADFAQRVERTARHVSGGKLVDAARRAQSVLGAADHSEADAIRTR